MFGVTESDPLTWTSTLGEPLPALPESTPALAPLTTESAQPAQPALSPVPLIGDASARRGAGTAIVLAGAGLTLGWLAGGGWGAGAGFILAGAARNGLRAKQLWSGPQPGDREEAAKSATMAAIGAAVGGYLAYRAVQTRRGITAEE